MNRKIIFFIFILTMSISVGPVMGESPYSFRGSKSNYGDFSRNLAPLSELGVQDPLSRLNDRVEAGITGIKYRSFFGTPRYRFYRRSPGHARHFKSPGHYFRYGYQRPFYRVKPYEHYYRFQPYRPYYKYKYFRYYFLPGSYYDYWRYGLNDYGFNLWLPWYWR